MKKILIIVCLILLIPFNVYAAKNPYKEKSSYGLNCTWYAWQNAHDLGGVTLPGWGNAKTWANRAREAGYEVGRIPKSNSILVAPSYTSYGHVVYVEKVVGELLYVYDTGTPCRDESTKAYQDCKASLYDPEKGYADSELVKEKCDELAPIIACINELYNVSPSHPSSAYEFIYLDSAPKTTKKTTIKSAPQSTTKKTDKTMSTTLTKSNDTSLINLKINSTNIELKKDIFEYDIEVESDVENIKIEAEPSNKNAKIEVQEQYTLSFGNNTITLTVTAEDGTIQNYVIMVNRKEVISTATSNKNETSEEIKKDRNSNIYFPIILSIFIIMLIIIYLIIRKKRNKLSN